ncbi:MAG: ATP-binding cassette domain-containing protein [Chlorobiaceae bacterium]|nr:ATP-binding cassette domain-containing protein [Chlorobiaceae bacterium]NTV17138.1 ATP-binding cassette domain-containing protein [Chlorobiaceae bacterium]
MIEILEKKIGHLTAEFPPLTGFFSDYGITFNDLHATLGDSLDLLPEEIYEDMGIDREKLLENLDGFLQRITLSEIDEMPSVSDITIIGGHDKSGKLEQVELTLVRGSITSIVGPTGSGKSRLLADIEWMAQNDTPTGRTIRVNGKQPDPELRFSLEYKLVAQLSQNMNFVMDATVADFVFMHAESRMINTIDTIVTDIIVQANLLAGEPFTAQTPLTALSGGQSRALMIADTAFLSSSPVVLIDEIENAGIDRKKALSLLVRREKIVLMATHDPILALMAEQRLIIKNGGIHKIIPTTTREKENLFQLEEFDNKLLALRTRLRSGELIEAL